MLKKFAKGLLDKEVVPHSDNQLPIERLLQSSYSSYEPLSTPSHFSKQENAIEEKEEDLSEPEVFIGENTVIKGFLSFHTLLRIDGTFEGELSSKGKIIIGPKGVVKGNIDLQEAFIAGKVEGNITVSERVSLRGRAVVQGNITAPLLSVDEGVSIQGKLHISQQPEEPVAQETTTSSADTCRDSLF
jgi:cytoskeletal protein CcmA (bactofilin family)